MRARARVCVSVLNLLFQELEKEMSDGAGNQLIMFVETCLGIWWTACSRSALRVPNVRRNSNISKGQGVGEAGVFNPTLYNGQDRPSW